MTMAAGTTIGHANRFRCAAGLCPCLFRRTGFDQKKTLVVRPVVLVSHALDHSLPDINRIKRHTSFVAPAERYAQGIIRIFASQAAPTHQELLSNIEQPEKIIAGRRRQAHSITIIWEDIWRRG